MSFAHLTLYVFMATACTTICSMERRGSPMIVSERYAGADILVDMSLPLLVGELVFAGSRVRYEHCQLLFSKVRSTDSIFQDVVGYEDIKKTLHDVFGF